MTKLELARKCAEIGDFENSVNAYTLALKENEHKDTLVDFECAMYILQFGEDYKLSYDTFIYLYNNGLYQKEIFDVMVTSFYAPNMSQLTEQFDANIKNLNKYKFIFNKSFIDFDDLKIKFFPYDDNHFIPFYTEKNQFGEKINFNYEEITHNFFSDLENPILAKDIYSQYELEYLNDNVRKSEWVGRENHIYLHYTDFAEFCSYLQVINFTDMLKEKKLVFLFDEEIEMYPIDFKEMFDIDYSKYPLKPLSVKEVNKLIWAVQLSSSNGGDFFNEVLDSHPNILLIHSLMHYNLEKIINAKNRYISQDTSLNISEGLNDTSFNFNISKYLKKYRDSLTEKDVLVAYALGQNKFHDRASRIVPAVYFQPHFHNLETDLIEYDEKGIISITEGIENTVLNYPFIKQFKYIKTFTPLRRMTTSYSSTMRFIAQQFEDLSKNLSIFNLSIRCMIRTYMISKSERVYRDSRVVRYEDGKLNPEATFTALAQFLDIPYTDTMKYCSRYGKVDAESDPTSLVGFDTRSVFRKYEEFVDPEEQYMLEYMQQNAYKEYKYDFQYYDGKEITEQKAEQLIEGCHKQQSMVCDRMKEFLKQRDDKYKLFDILINGRILFAPSITYENEDERLEDIDKLAKKYYKFHTDKLKEILMTIDPNARVIDENGDDKVFMKLLEPIEELMVEPLYH